MDKTDKDALIRLTTKIASLSTKAAALNGIAVLQSSTGETAKAHITAQRSDEAKDEAEVTYQEFLAYLDRL